MMQVHEQEKDRIFRVFLSSPFGGMEKERELLTKKYFPKLAVKCEKAGFFFVPVDLRWGVTEQDAKQRASVAEICLREVDRSDAFVGFFGQRYGWYISGMNEEADQLFERNLQKVVPQYPWIQGYRDRSITEIEFLHAHLLQEREVRPSWFLFRDESYDAQLAEAAQTEAERRRFQSESPEAKEKLQALKAKVEADSTKRGLNVNYPNPEEGARQIFEYLDSYLDGFLAGRVSSEFDRDNRDHEIFAISRARVYIGGEKYLSQMEEHLEKKGNQSLVILGQSGSGKSSLLANWILKPPPRAQKYRVFYHFIGSSPESANPVNILRRLFQFLYQAIGTEGVIPGDLASLSTQLPRLLQQAAFSGQHFALVFDALNQLDAENPSLSWLPKQFPEQVWVIVSTLEGFYQEEVVDGRGWAHISVEPLTSEEKRTFITATLNIRGKNLSEEQVETIIGSALSSTPLYLQTVVNELCLHGDFFTLDDRIRFYLSGPDGKYLFNQVLTRLEEDYNRELVEEVMSLLSLARFGLGDHELAEILVSGERYSQLDLSLLLTALSWMLVDRSGLYVFFHEQLRHAVMRRYLADEQTYQTRASSLLDYFQGVLQKELGDSPSSLVEVSQRIADELPWQLQKLQKHELLHQALTRPGLFWTLSTPMRKYELLSYWRSVLKSPEAGGGRLPGVVEANKEMIRAHAATDPPVNQRVSLIHRVADLLELMDLYSDAAELVEESLSLWNADGLGVGDENFVPAAKALTRLGLLYQNKGDYTLAEKNYQRALEMLRQAQEEQEALSVVLGNLGTLFRKNGRYNEALDLHQQSIQIKEKVLGKFHPIMGTTYDNLGIIMKDLARFEEGLGCHKLALEIREAVLGPSHPDTAITIDNMGVLLKDMGRFAESITCHERGLQIRTRVLGNEHMEVALSLHNLGNVLDDVGRHREALESLSRALSIRKAIVGPHHPHSAANYCNLGIVEHNLGLMERALETFQEAVKARKAALVPGHAHIYATINNLGVHLEVMGRYGEAEEHLLSALECREKTYGADHIDVAASNCNVGCLSAAKGDLEDARRRFLLDLEISSKRLGESHHLVGVAHFNLGCLCLLSGTPQEALPHFEKDLAITKMRYGEEHPYVGRSLWALGLAHLAMMEQEKALDLFSSSLTSLSDPPSQTREAVNAFIEVASQGPKVDKDFLLSHLPTFSLVGFTLFRRKPVHTTNAA